MNNSKKLFNETYELLRCMRRSNATQYVNFLNSELWGRLNYSRQAVTALCNVYVGNIDTAENRELKRLVNNIIRIKINDLGDKEREILARKEC